MTTFFGVTAVLLLLANILQAVVAISNKGKVQEAEDGKAAAMSMLKQATDKAAKIQDERDKANHLRDQYEKTMRAAMEENDRMMAERATLYYRNSKGRIVPITPKPRNPHTLKHGMTVKDPTPEQAKRIFREAKRAGVSIEDLTGGGDVAVLVFSSKDTNLAAKDAVLAVCSHINEATYITASEFVKRIKGEVE